MKNRWASAAVLGSARASSQTARQSAPCVSPEVSVRRTTEGQEMRKASNALRAA